MSGVGVGVVGVGVVGVGVGGLGVGGWCGGFIGWQFSN